MQDGVSIVVRNLGHASLFRICLSKWHCSLLHAKDVKIKVRRKQGINAVGERFALDVPAAKLKQSRR